MTDQELTAWLRDLAEALGKEAFTRAADRIELLTAESQKDGEEILYLRERAEQLAKAVEVMKSLQEDMLERSRAGMDTIHGEEYRIVNAGRTAWNDFCATLAELEGE